jgi:hypothetical protein
MLSGTVYINCDFWHVYVLGPTYFVWPWKSSEPHRTIRDVTPGSLSAIDTCIVYHVSHFEASRNVILHTCYVSTCVGAGCGKGRGTKNKSYPLWSMLLLTYDMYKSSLRHTHDPVLSSLKMKGIVRLLFIRFLTIALYLWKVSSLVTVQRLHVGFPKIIVQHPRVLLLNTPCVQESTHYYLDMQRSRSMNGADIYRNIRGFHSLWRMSSGIWRRVVWCICTKVSEAIAASTIRLDDKGISWF